MKKADWLLDKFFSIYTIFIYSLAFPLFLFLAMALGGLAEDFSNLLIPKYPYIYYGVSIIVGLKLKSWRENGKKKKK